MTFIPLINKPILHISDLPESDTEKNINGPSLIRAPSWIMRPLGKYYLYFAHHRGDHIRLAYADDLAGPWTIYQPGTLHLGQSHFPMEPPDPSQLHPIARRLVEEGLDGTYPHIASPDVIVDRDRGMIRLYYHGRVENGLQLTRVAQSRDGIRFKALPTLIGRSYMRVFQHRGWWYGLAMPGYIYRSRDGFVNFEEGENLFKAFTPRHFGLLKDGNRLHIFWSEIGGLPEQIKHTVVDISQTWTKWHLTEQVNLIRKPEQDWEGGHEPLIPSKVGGVFEPVNQLRDPAVYREGDDIYLLYSVAGEQGIGIAKAPIRELN